MPIDCSVNGLPFGAITSAPAFTQRLASGISEVMTISPLPGALRDPVVGGVHPGAGRDALDQRILRHPDEVAGDHADRQAMAGGDAVDLVLDRAGVGVDIDAGGVQWVSSVGDWLGRASWRSQDARRTPSDGELRAKHGRNTLATAFSSRTIIERKDDKNQGKQGMTSRLETYRVQAYNTAKLSENKMHDDTVAKRFGFCGGLVPGVDVMAYMMHLPVAKWGRAFLERGLIEARFVKPVYDGEIADVRGEESDGVLSIEVESRGATLRHRQRVAARVRAVGFAFGFHGSRRGGRAQAGECGVL